MSLRKGFQVVCFVRASLLFSAAVVYGQTPSPGSNNFDTNGDKKDDLTVHSTKNRVHFDTNNNGVEDSGELVIENVTSYSHAIQHPSGYKFTISYMIDKEHVGTYKVTVNDLNGDGDTADRGELTY